MDLESGSCGPRVVGLQACYPPTGVAGCALEVVPLGLEVVLKRFNGYSMM